MTIKRGRLAGSWYARDAAQLSRQVDEFLGAASGEQAAALLGLIVPHAGYVYSGRAAAAGYRRLRGGDCQRVTILAPSHYAAFHGVVVLEVDGFETPLGTVPVHRGGVETLLGGSLYRSDAGPFQDEHSLEIQLPLLQRVLPNVPVVPALVGDLGPDDFATAASTLAQLDDGKTVFVVSSDFVHYGWRFGYVPFAAEGPEQVRTALRGLDMGAITRIGSGDVQAFRDYLAETGATICGALPITLFLTFHRRRTPGELVEYYSSLDVTGDFEHTVSYASIVFPRP